MFSFNFRQTDSEWEITEGKRSGKKPWAAKNRRALASSMEFDRDIAEITWPPAAAAVVKEVEAMTSQCGKCLSSCWHFNCDKQQIRTRETGLRLSLWMINEPSMCVQKKSESIKIFPILKQQRRVKAFFAALQSDWGGGGGGNKIVHVAKGA